MYKGSCFNHREEAQEWTYLCRSSGSFHQSERFLLSWSPKAFWQSSQYSWRTALHTSELWNSYIFIPFMVGIKQKKEKKRTTWTWTFYLFVYSLTDLTPLLDPLKSVAKLSQMLFGSSSMLVAWFMTDDKDVVIFVSYYLVPLRRVFTEKANPKQYEKQKVCMPKWSTVWIRSDNIKSPSLQ